MKRTDLSKSPAVYKVLKSLTGSYLVTDAKESIACMSSPARSLLRLTGQAITPNFADRGVLFIHVPKSAGTSVARTLYGRDINHHTARYYHMVDPAAFGTIPSFGIIRDPVERTLSAFSHVLAKGGRDRPLHPAWFKKFGRLKTLTDFLWYVRDHRNALYELDTVMRPQAGYVCGEDGKLLVTRCFVLGSRELDLYLQSLGVPSLQKANGRILEHVKPTILELRNIENLYQIDFDLFEQLRKSLIEAAPRGHNVGDYNNSAIICG